MNCCLDEHPEDPCTTCALSAEDGECKLKAVNGEDASSLEVDLVMPVENWSNNFDATACEIWHRFVRK